MLYKGLSGQIEYAKIKSTARVRSVVKQGAQPISKERRCKEKVHRKADAQPEHRPLKEGHGRLLDVYGLVVLRYSVFSFGANFFNLKQVFVVERVANRARASSGGRLRRYTIRHDGRRFFKDGVSDMPEDESYYPASVLFGYINWFTS